MSRHRAVLHSRLVSLALAAGILAVPFVGASVAQANKAVIGTFGGPDGEDNGQLNRPQGIAVNLTGAGGVTAGDVYVVDSDNNRIDEFSAGGTFVRAFGYDVVASGPDNTGANERQTLTVDATGGTFALAVTRRTYAETTEGSNVVRVYAPTSAFHVGDVVGGFFPEGTTVTAVGTQSLVLSATSSFSGSHSGFTGTETSAPIAYGATAGELEAALVALPAVGVGNVAVTGANATSGLEIEYTGALSHNAAFNSKSAIGEQGGLISTTSTALSGATHTATIATTVSGGGYEVCDGSVPTDVCKAGPYCNRAESAPEACRESSAAGSLDEPSGVAIDQRNGNVYVVDTTDNSGVTNSRVNVYSATGAFEGAFGWDVNAADPKEELQFCTTATGCRRGTLGSGTGEFGEVDLDNPTVVPVGAPGAGDVVFADGGNSRTQEFAPTLNGANELIGVKFVDSVGWDVVASGPDQSSETQKFTVKAAAGKFKLTFNAATTNELPYNATAKEVEDALDALASIGGSGGSVEVTGGPGDAAGSDAYTVIFNGGSLSHADVAQATAAKVGLSGGTPTTSVSVETYANGTEGLEYCVAARGDTCKVGTQGRHLGQFGGGGGIQGPTSVAVDTTGALYAVNQRNTQCGLESNPPTGVQIPCRLYKFTSPGPGEIVANEFAPAYLTYTNNEDGSAVSANDVAVDPENQHVLVAKAEGKEAYKFLEFDSSGALLAEAPSKGALNSVIGFGGGLAIGIGQRFYYSNESGVVDIFGPPPAPGLSIAGTSGVGTTMATFHGTVTPPASVEGEFFDTSYHFEYSVDGVNWSRVPTADVDVGDGSGSGVATGCPVNNPPTCVVEQVVSGLVPNTDYQVRLVASTGTAATSSVEHFTTEPAPPLVSGTVVEEIGETAAELKASVNPANEPATYRFEWGTDISYGNSVPTQDGPVGSGGEPVGVSASLEGLKGGTVYHFRVVASNPSGTTDGPDREFSTLNRYGLPDGRAPEQVSPNDKRPVGMVAQLLEGQLAYQPSSDGNSVLYPLQNGTVEATAGGDVEYMGSRGESGWSPVQVTPPSLVPVVGANGIGSDTTGTVLYASPDLSCVILESFEPLTADTPAEDVVDGVHNLYRRNADGSYTLLSSGVPFNKPQLFKAAFHLDWASTDCSHVLFETAYQLLEEASPSGTSLYEWAEGSVSLAGVRPDSGAPGGESVANDAVAGLGSQENTWNSVSEDGSKVFFTAASKAGKDATHKAVFVRENGTSTIDASQSQTATVDQEAVFATASADGSHVFFLANYGLATNGTSSGSGNCTGQDTTACDLYDYDTVTKTLTDRSVDVSSGDVHGAGVVGVFDASADGSYVYFAARGQLVPGMGKSEAENLQGSGTYNVYLSHEGVLSDVGLVASNDVVAHAATGSDVTFNTTHWVSDATPDGKHLLFVSRANVTGYDSKGVDEAYLYSAETGETVCVSCRTDGKPSEGTGNTEPITIDPAPSEKATPLSFVLNRPRSLSDDGRRVFFTMPDVLAAGAKARTRNIYEWEAGNVYLLVPGEEAELDFTRYVGTSTSGNDVFVVTKEKLVAQDFDKTTDLYDLRVGGGLPEPGPETPPCDPLSGACQREATPQLVEALGSASEAFSGPGNPPPPPPPVVVPCKKGLVLVHGKCVSKKAVAKRKTLAKCRKAHVRKHGKCVRKASASRHKRATGNHGRAAR